MFADDKFYSPTEIAEKLGVSPAQVRVLIDEGKLKSKNLSAGKKRPTYRCLGLWVNQFMAPDDKETVKTQERGRPCKTFV